MVHTLCALLVNDSQTLNASGPVVHNILLFSSEEEEWKILNETK